MRRKLLVVGDVFDRQEARTILEALGYEVLSAEDGDEALKCCAESHPDVALVDLHLPDMTAGTFINKLRHVPANGSIKVIVAVTQDSMMNCAYLGTLGADSTTRKPFSRQCLAADMYRLLPN